MPGPLPSEAGRLGAIAEELHRLAARMKSGTGPLEAAVADVQAVLPPGWHFDCTWYGTDASAAAWPSAELGLSIAGNLVRGDGRSDVEALSALAAALRERAK